MVILKVCITVLLFVSCSKGKFYLIKVAENKTSGYDYADQIENKPLGEPSLLRKAERCAKVGADGRKNGKKKIHGFQITYHKAKAICM